MRPPSKTFKRRKRPKVQSSAIQKLAITVAAFLAVELISPAAFSFDKHTDALTDAHIRQLLLVMDKGKSGAISKNEFMRYISQRFDSLDVDHSRRLEPDEIQAMNIPNWVIRKSPARGEH